MNPSRSAFSAWLAGHIGRQRPGEAGFAARAWLCGVALALAMPVAGLGVARAAEAQNVVADPAFEKRVQALSAELRCLVCQNQSLADSHAELALDLKNQVREQLKAGRTEQQVVEYMTQRYGDFVLYRPPFKATTLLLWLGPALLVLGGLFVFVRSLRASQAVAPAEPVAAADAARAAQLLGETAAAPSAAADGVPPAAAPRA